MALPPLESFRVGQQRLAGLIRRTPVWRWDDPLVLPLLPDGATIHLKLELFQHTGTFKPRGALLTALALSPAQRAAGLVAVSAGNHAIATAFVARQVGASAKVFMPRAASPARVERAQAFGAEVILAADIHEAFARGESVARDEGRVMVHPFEGPDVTVGTGTLGLELAEQLEHLDAVVVPVGGGGLAGGIAAALRHVRPECEVFGVEPIGSAVIRKSLDAGRPVALPRIDSVADSLGAPRAESWSFGLIRELLTDLVLVDDDALCGAMVWLFDSLKLAVEPAAAASTAAVLGPLAPRLVGKHVAVIVCGANIDEQTFVSHLERGRRHRGVVTRTAR